MKNQDHSFFEEPVDPRIEARELAKEVICRFLLWMNDAPTTMDRGLRGTVALYCVRPDLMDGATLEKIGEEADRTRQYIHKLAEDFRQTLGIES